MLLGWNCSCHSNFTCSHGIKADMIPLPEEMLEKNSMKKNRTSYRSELNRYVITSEPQVNLSILIVVVLLLITDNRVPLYAKVTGIQANSGREMMVLYWLLKMFEEAPAKCCV
ncbi:LOW QUALITY PROTEIN: hypothetical protein HID58_073979 [Brassica napus]|uniref:Uncharacterized protein n=1 Tax=Brassica napus TaxID=3708 RepID=A0ABQ7YFM0_BRANA|nr:LOW QUALITY PROTEIN: hypothetical protein HID58_073979 [Brassica napus]